MKYSGVFKRFFAYVIDLFVICGIYFLATFVFSGWIPALPMPGFWFYAGLILCRWLYSAGCESSKFQATIGKNILGIKVVDFAGKRVSFYRATARHFSKIFSYLFFLLGFLMIFWSKNKQSLHDKIASTSVIEYSN